MSARFPLVAIFLCIAAASADTRSALQDSLPAKAGAACPWYKQPEPYYVVGGALFLAGVATGFGTDGCQEPYNAQCRTLMTTSQLTGFPGMILLGIGLWRQFKPSPECKGP